MLSALRPQAARPGLPRPLRGRLAVGVPAAVPRSGDGAGQQRPALRRPERRPPPPAHQEQRLVPSSPQQRREGQQRPSRGGTNRLSSAELMQQIKGAQSSQRVVQLVQQAGQQCSAFHFSRAVNRLAKMQQRRPSASNQAAHAALLSFAEQHPAVLDHVTVAQMVYAGGVLQQQLTAEQQAAWQERLVRAFAHPELEPQHVSNSLWGWSRMGLPLKGKLAVAADAAMAQMAGQMKPQEVSNTLLAFANASWTLDSRAAAALLQQLEQVLPQAKPQEVANSLWAAAKLGLQPSGSLASAAAAAIQRTAGQMVPQEVSNTLWAYATSSWQLSSSQQATMLQQLEQVLPQAKPQEVAISLWAAAKLGLQLSGSLSAGSVAAIQRTAGQMGSQGVSNTLWAYANAGWALDSKAAAMLLQRLEQVLPQANAQDVANSLWAAAKLGLQLSSSLKAALTLALLRILPAANSQALGNGLLACGKLRWSPGVHVLAAVAAAMQRLLTSGVVEAQHVCNFLWGLAELQDQLGIRPPNELPALLVAAADWADSRWAQLSALDVVDLCYNLARLGHRPGRAWIGSAINRCLECIEAGALEGARFANFIWACSSWGHRLQHSELEQLVPAAVNNVATHWEEGGRGGGFLLGEALTRQAGFQAGPDHPATSAALEGRLLPLVCSDIDRIAAGRLHPEASELPYLASWAAHLAAIGLRLPEQQLEAICSYVRQHPQQLQQGASKQLQQAFNSAGYDQGLAVLQQMGTAKPEVRFGGLQELLGWGASTQASALQ